MDNEQTTGETGTALITLDSRYQIWEAAGDSKNARLSLAGVHFDPATGRAQAADGFILAAVPFKSEELTEAVLIPADFVKELATKATRKGDDIKILIRDGKAWSIDTSRSALLMQVTFPDTNKLWPSDSAGGPQEITTFDAAHAVRLSKALGAYDRRTKQARVQFHFPGSTSSPIVVIGDNESVGLMMPMFAAKAENVASRFPRVVTPEVAAE